MKPSALTLCAIICLAASFGAPRIARCDEQSLDRTVALVNSELLYLSDVRHEAMLAQMMDAEKRGNPVNAPEALLALINRKLLVQYASQRNMTVDNAIIVRRVEDWIAGLAQSAGGREAYQRRLAKENIDEEQVKRLIYQREKERMLAQRAAASRVQLNQADVQAFIKQAEAEGRCVEQAVLAHIWLPYPPEATEEDRAAVREKARSIYRELENGAPFNSLVRSYSQDAATRAQDGYLGAIDITALDATVAEALKDKAPGEFTEPVMREKGCQLLLLLHRITPRDYLYRERFEQFSQDLIEELRNDATIEILDEELKRGVETLRQKNDSPDAASR